MIQEKKILFFKSVRILYQGENLDDILDKKRYDLMTVVSYNQLDLERFGFKLKHKKLANISLKGSVEEILYRFARRTRQEISNTFDINDLVIKIGEKNNDDIYILYREFEIAQGRKPWKRDSFDGVINFNAYYKGELIACVPCYDLRPYLQVRAIFSKRLDAHRVLDKNLYKLIGSATRRLIFEICRYGKHNSYDFVGLGSVNYSTQQKSNVADFKMFFGPEIGDEYTYTYESRRAMFFLKLLNFMVGCKML